MPVNFDDSTSFVPFANGENLDDAETGFARQSELVLSALKSAGLFDNFEISETPPSTTKIWLDKSVTPYILKQYDAGSLSWVPSSFNSVFGGVSPLPSLSIGLPWTPELTDAYGNVPNHRTQYGRYCNLGGLIVFSWSLQLNTKTGLLPASAGTSSYLRINGLPFPVHNEADNSFRGGAYITYYGQSALGSAYGISGIPVQGESYFGLYKQTATAMSPLTSNDCNNTVSIHGIGFYIAEGYGSS